MATQSRANTIEARETPLLRKENLAIRSAASDFDLTGIGTASRAAMFIIAAYLQTSERPPLQQGAEVRRKKGNRSVSLSFDPLISVNA
jgi:hypothetical protein